MNYSLTNQRRHPVSMLVALWLGLVAIGISQNVPDDPEPYPPKTYPASVVSSDITFSLRKLEGAPPARSGEDFVYKTVQILKKTDPRQDLEVEVTGELGYHTIESKP